MDRIALLLAVSLMSAFGFAAGESASGAATDIRMQGVTQTPQQRAVSHYNTGLKHKKTAWKNEKRAGEANTEKKRDKYLKRAQKAYAKSIKSHTAAIKAYPQAYQSASELGYALRKTGDFRQAIGAYNYALGINPDYHPAIEYRGEAYLALGYINEAKEAYMQLFRGDPELATQLMAAMETWLVQQGEPAIEQSATQSLTAAELATWVEERKNLAKISNDLSQNSARVW